ncbi:YjiH family protein [Bacillus fonticola]|uniref:YjiH family protein n=1 Tax=Bacillus fonticola TaxID=2728853 RepID=UPI001473E588|nr:YjiH family protein [Bacillus fonticola]
MDSGKEKGKLEQLQNDLTVGHLLLFIIPSVLGIFLFMIPIQYGGEMTIPVAIMASELGGALGTALPSITLAIIFISVLGSIIYQFSSAMHNSPFFTSLFKVNLFWFVVRVLGLLFAAMTVFQIGPAAVTGEYIGQLLLNDLLSLLVTVFLFAGLLLPLLLNFGLLEFVGSLVIKVMRPLFRLPGRSAIDCLTSWVGDGTIGVLLTSKQYEEGYYTKREAAVIGTTFSVVSITFSIAVLDALDLAYLFGPYYLTIVVAGIIAALIMPRIPPLSRKPDTYYEGAEAKADETIPEGINVVKYGLLQATHQAGKSKDIGVIVKSGVQNALDMWFGVLPVVMAFGTIALVLAENTPLFAWLGAPFQPLLALLQIPEAAAAAETMVVGFADMFLPATLGGDIMSDQTRFVIGAVSVTQLIYMSEVGGLLLGSKVPVNFLDLVLIFLLRTLITLPVIALASHLIF